MFVWQVKTLLDEMRRLLPDVYEVLMAIADAWDTPRREQVLESLWPTLRDVTIDHGIMEHAARVAVVPANLGWTDLGDWHSLADMLAGARGDNLVVSGQHLAVDTESTLVFGNRRVIATLGVKDLVIVDTDDVVLVCHKDRAQDVRSVVQHLKECGQESIL